MSLTLAQRILAHLARFPVPEDAPVVPRDVTQDGIAEALGVQPAHVSRALKGLMGQGLVRAHLAHPKGGKRRSRAHTLTETGRAAAKAVPAEAEPPRAAAPAPARAHRGPPAGRAAAWATLLAALEDARHGPSTLLLEGVSGAGKTRLLEHFTAEAAQRGFRVVRGHTLPVGAPQLLGPLGPALDELAFQDRMRARQGGTERERAMAAALETVTAAARRQPLVVLLDDVHHAGAPMVEFLHGLLLGLPADTRLLVVAAFRQEEAWELPNGPLYTALYPLRALPRARLVTLEPLGERELGEMLADAGFDGLGADALARIWRESGGNCAYALAMAETLDEAGAGDFFPAPVRVLARERFAGLPPDAMEVLQIAAVAGVEVSYDVLEAAAEAGEDALVRALDKLLDLLLLEEVPRAEALWLRFEHPKVREAVLADLRAPRRRYLEERVALAEAGRPAASPQA